MTDYQWIVGLDGKLRRYEVLLANSWVDVVDILPLPVHVAKNMRGYRVIEMGRGIIRQFIEP